jgi:hypothetical protein
MDKSATFTSQWVTDCIKRQNGFTSTMTVWFQGTLRNKAQTNNHTSSTCMPPPTTVSTCPLSPYLHGSGTCSLVPAGTSTSSKPLWLTLTTGAWHEKSRGTGKSMSMSPISQSRSRSTNRTLRQCRPTLCHVSPALCSPKP